MSEEKKSLSELPKRWVWTTLGEIQLDLSQSVTPNITPARMFELYSVPSFEIGQPDIVSGKEIGSSKRTVEIKAVLLCKINPRINRIWIVESHSAWPKIASTEWIPFFYLEGLEPKYLCYFMQNNHVRDFLASNASGVGGSLMRIKSSTISRYHFPLAPRSEQQRIVAKVEELFTKLDAGKEELKKVKTQLKRYRQSVLKAAVEGRLTQEWRKEHKGEIESASVLLERILKERREKWEAEQLTQMKAKGKLPKDDSWKKKYEEPVEPDTADLSKLPVGWCWATVEQLSVKVQYGSSEKTSGDSGEIPVLRMGTVISG